ncbi:hypothetical protein J2Y55_001107 [Bosea sp. BE125]|uniref:hypothetical protein n=1 Tax=Bosea sp. BE125 TaxID=2817909 RepID=UPI0028619B78|nr:hypothetical protein [Bosea sp. BE125]MDR6870107.1 hypothetical protein [Bosea sp. BE125]
MSQAPTDETTLEHYPWIVARFRCTRCRRYGDSRLARLAEKFGATETIAALISRFHATCPNRPRSRSGRIVLTNDRCGGYCPDLGATKPPDLPPAVGGLSLIEGGKADMLPAEPGQKPRHRRVGGGDE